MKKESVALSHEELAKACFLLSEQSFNEKSPWSEKQFLESLESENKAIFLSFEKKCLVGFIIISVVLDEAEIELVSVSKDFKRKKIGTQLLKEAIENLKQMKVSSLFLEVRQSNTSALGFYRSFKFEEIGFRKNYYKAPKEDGLILKLTL
ncbi:ribosomal protein S18-alanine N-acetyltransferase [Vagococcus carniphilus]|uniref:ribosomal protein S18-alanine N-acetyltransferase n=1 Tax=Vagococcus carniphilus TaxID=218144 RepID=UPI003B5B94FE